VSIAIQDSTGREQEFHEIETRHGGYWRYDFVDHAYLYNLYFPPERFFSQLSHQIHELVLNYPVAQDVFAELVGTLIDQPPERIVVGNGAAELIKIISGHLATKLIVPVPSFNEYVDAAPSGKVIEFALDVPSFQLDVDRFAAEIIRQGADVAVVVSPNNPTSLLVPKAELVRLLDRLATHDCMLIIDESFIDFADDPQQATLAPDIAAYPNLAIIKSMSKAYGICGLRIGYLLTANERFAERVRDGLHIWNLNGFAESFLVNAPDYQQQFLASCDRVRADRDQFYEELCAIERLTVYRPDANYVFCRLPDDAPSGVEIARRLFVENDIYIKHCQGKTMPDSDRYVRIASRTQDENRVVARCLARIIAPTNTS
jgi:histidinol-phosphate/aromatic aminotransferase/cobyric acid decarboxylase-like protein